MGWGTGHSTVGHIHGDTLIGIIPNGVHVCLALLLHTPGRPDLLWSGAFSYFFVIVRTVVEVARNTSATIGICVLYWLLHAPVTPLPCEVDNHCPLPSKCL